jgi:hypothetical protein
MSMSTSTQTQGRRNRRRLKRELKSESTSSPLWGRAVVSVAILLAKVKGQYNVLATVSSLTFPHAALLLHFGQIVLPLELLLVRPSVLLGESFDLLTALVIFLDLPDILFVDREHLEVDQALLHVSKTISSGRESQGIFVRHPWIPDGDRAIGRVEGYVVAILLLHTMSVKYSGSEAERCDAVRPTSL